jgi:thiamine-phosphate diphosphorylase
MLARPLISLVTDRRRLAQRLGLDPDGELTGQRLADLVAGAADAGIHLVQVRENDLPTRVLADWIRRFLEIAEGTRTRIIVNDRLDVALVAGAHGVHLKDGSVAIQRIRAAAPPAFLVGQSIHSPEDAADAAADYLVFGTVFSTRSKPRSHETAGLAGLEAAVRRARVPVLGIGGVNLTQLPKVAGAGAAGIAGVDMFLPGAPGLVGHLRKIAGEVRQMFDTAGSAL